MVFVGSKEGDVVLVVRRDGDEAIGSESDIQKDENGVNGLYLVR